jgi:hypothetical protein
VSLAKSFCFRLLFASWCALFLEGRGDYPVSGAQAGTSTHELLLGVRVPLTEGLDMRAGWSLLWPEGGDADSGWVLGVTVHL